MGCDMPCQLSAVCVPCLFMGVPCLFSYPKLSPLWPSCLPRPPYLSNLIFELWRRPSGQQYVKVSGLCAGRLLPTAPDSEPRLA